MEKGKVNVRGESVFRIFIWIYDPSISINSGWPKPDTYYKLVIRYGKDFLSSVLLVREIDGKPTNDKGNIKIFRGKVGQFQTSVLDAQFVSSRNRAPFMTFLWCQYFKAFFSETGKVM